MANRWFLINEHYYSLDVFSEFRVEWCAGNTYAVIEDCTPLYT